MCDICWPAAIRADADMTPEQFAAAWTRAVPAASTSANQPPKVRLIECPPLCRVTSPHVGPND